MRGVVASIGDDGWSVLPELCGEAGGVSGPSSTTEHAGAAITGG